MGMTDSKALGGAIGAAEVKEKVVGPRSVARMTHIPSGPRVAILSRDVNENTRFRRSANTPRHGHRHPDQTHPCWRLISRRSQARAYAQYRLAVGALMPSTPAAS